jgi:hypothetical protein
VRRAALTAARSAYAYVSLRRPALLSLNPGRDKRLSQA